MSETFEHLLARPADNLEQALFDAALEAQNLQELPPTTQPNLEALAVDHSNTRLVDDAHAPDRTKTNGAFITAIPYMGNVDPYGPIAAAAYYLSGYAKTAGLTHIPMTPRVFADNASLGAPNAAATTIHSEFNDDNWRVTKIDSEHVDILRLTNDTAGSHEHARRTIVDTALGVARTTQAHKPGSLLGLEKHVLTHSTESHAGHASSLLGYRYIRSTGLHLAENKIPAPYQHGSRNNAHLSPFPEDTEPRATVSSTLRYAPSLLTAIILSNDAPYDESFVASFCEWWNTENGRSAQNRRLPYTVAVPDIYLNRADNNAKTDKLNLLQRMRTNKITAEDIHAITQDTTMLHTAIIALDQSGIATAFAKHRTRSESNQEKPSSWVLLQEKNAVARLTTAVKSRRENTMAVRSATLELACDMNLTDSETIAEQWALPGHINGFNTEEHENALSILYKNGPEAFITHTHSKLGSDAPNYVVTQNGPRDFTCVLSYENAGIQRTTTATAHSERLARDIASFNALHDTYL